MIKTAAVDVLTSRKLWIFFLAICLAFFAVKPVFAQEASGSGQAAVKKHNIVFPISTLGNCADLQSCRTYCEDPANKEACLNFAKTKGFHKPPQGQGNARARLVIEKAKTELGCKTEEECKTLCAKEENAQKCADFARKYGINNGPRKLINNSVLEKAKAALGCTNEEACKALCKLEVNRDKCSQFARSAGLPGGMVKIPPMLGKNQAGYEQVRKTIEKCTQNPDYCRQNVEAIEKQLMDVSQEFCKSNPDKCREFLGGLKEASRGGKFTPNSDKAYENANANARFCRENPEKCKNASGSGTFDAMTGRPEKIQFKDKVEIIDPQVQGASKTPSFFDWFFNVFLK